MIDAYVDSDGGPIYLRAMEAKSSCAVPESARALRQHSKYPQTAPNMEKPQIFRRMLIRSLSAGPEVSQSHTERSTGTVRRKALAIMIDLWARIVTEMRLLAESMLARRIKGKPRDTRNSWYSYSFTMSVRSSSSGHEPVRITVGNARLSADAPSMADNSDSTVNCANFTRQPKCVCG